MTNIISLALLVAALFVFGATGTKAQTRIQFAKGKSSATVSGSTGIYGANYVLRHRGGQKLALTLSPNSTKVGILVQNDAGDEILLRRTRGGSYVIYLEDGGDARILVNTTNGKPVAFTLKVAITNMTDI